MRDRSVTRPLTILGFLLVFVGSNDWQTVWGDTKKVDIVHYAERGKTRDAKGTVQDFDSRGVHILLPSGQMQTIDAEQVLWIETPRTVAQDAARLAAADGQYAKAARSYLRLLEMGREDREWVQQEIRYELVLALVAEGQYDRAAKVFSQVLAKDPPARYFDAIPLVWIGGFSLSPRAEALAMQWLRSGAAAERLLGASLLLGTGKTQEAERTLQELSQNATNPIAALAEVQSLRLRIPTATEKEIRVCAQAIDRLPPSLRGGPYYILGRLYAVTGDERKAAVAAMRVPILYHDPRLAAESLLTAGKAMIKSGLTEEGVRVYDELIAEYPQSTAAAEAKQKREAQSLAP